MPPLAGPPSRRQASRCLAALLKLLASRGPLHPHRCTCHSDLQL